LRLRRVCGTTPQPAFWTALEEFETGPPPIQFLYPHSRILSPTVRAFADLCVRKLRQTAFD
jgi:hypothetical protein